MVVTGVVKTAEGRETGHIYPSILRTTTGVKQEDIPGDKRLLVFAGSTSKRVDATRIGETVRSKRVDGSRRVKVGKIVGSARKIPSDGLVTIVKQHCAYQRKALTDAKGAVAKNVALVSPHAIRLSERGD